MTEHTDEHVDDKAERDLVTWVMNRVNEWEEDRNEKLVPRWKEYYRLWRGIYTEEDKTRKSERSKLISPAMQQAVEMSVAELEEATFGRGRWFDVDDDYGDDVPEDILAIRNLLLEDLDDAGVRTAVADAYLNGALYGTGILKLAVEETTELEIMPQPVTDGSSVMMAGTRERAKIVVRPVSVSPFNFVIDTAATSLEDALGAAEILDVPTHKVLAKQASGVYLDRELGNAVALSEQEENDRDTDTENSTKIIEYHGLAPRHLLAAINSDVEEALVALEDEEYADLPDSLDEYDLVEAIITIANDGILLRAVENPVLKRDRAFVAFPYERIPNMFWGRGIAEKGFNVQKALDAELRGRIDAMALTIHPMMAMDATRLVRGGDLSVAPGRNILTNGDPNTILRPLNFGAVNNQTFSQSGELERMLQMATGTMDSAAPIGVSPRNATASGMSMIMSGAIKRSKRTLLLIEENLLTKLVHKAAWRYMQFDPERYPARDVKFKVRGTLGMMAREFESQQISNLLNTVPPTSPAFWMLIQNIYELSSITNKEEMLVLVKQLLQQSLQPPAPPPDPKVELDKAKLLMEAQDKAERRAMEQQRIAMEVARLQLAIQKAPSEIAKAEAQAMLDVANAEAAELGKQMEVYRTIVESLKAG